MKLHEYPVIVVVWAQEGCGMCEEYTPRFRAIAQSFAGCIPAAVFDIATIDDDWLAHYGVQFTPTTMVLRMGQVTARRNAAVDDATIAHLFSLAAIGQECQIP